MNRSPYSQAMPLSNFAKSQLRKIGPHYQRHLQTVNDADANLT